MECKNEEKKTIFLPEFIPIAFQKKCIFIQFRSFFGLFIINLIGNARNEEYRW